MQGDDDAFPDLLQLEVEALRATYADDVEVTPAAAGGGGARVALAAAPRGVPAAQQFVAATLVLEAGPDYPAAPPRVALAAPRGLPEAEAAAAEAALRRAAAALAGELSLGALCEAALDALDGANRPHGACCLLCLEEFGAAAAPAADFVKLGCFHAFHARCFGPWWRWRQEQAAARAAEARHEWGALAAARLEEEGVVLLGEEEGYAVACPVCRRPAELGAAACAALRGDGAGEGEGAGAGEGPG